MHALLLHGASARLDYGDPKAHLIPSCDTPPPVGSEVYAMRSLPARNITTPHPPSFYLHDQGAHDWSDEEDLHWSLSPFSQNMCPGRAQHQGGIYVLQALRQHWARSRDKHNASVHVSAALMFEAGMKVFNKKGQPTSCTQHQDETRYQDRLDALADELGAPNSTFRQGKPFIFLTASAPGEGVMFGHARLNAALRLGNPVFLTNDANYMGQDHWRKHKWDDDRVAFKQTRVLLPYLSDDYLANDPTSAGRPMEERSGVQFHGAMTSGREDDEPRTVRLDMANVLRHLDYSRTPSDIRTEELPQTNAADAWGEVPGQVVATRWAMQAARICIAPEGDTPMTRRVVDALAAGCVPLIYLDADEDTDGKVRAMPLAHSIDWRSIALFMKASDCPARDAAWLEEQHADVDTLAAMSHRGRDAFDRFLSFGTRKREDKDDKDALPMRMASALLEEVAIVSRPKSQLEIVLALAD